jgi:hypothetical protein
MEVPTNHWRICGSAARWRARQQSREALGLGSRSDGVCSGESYPKARIKRSAVIYSIIGRDIEEESEDC